MPTGPALPARKAAGRRTAAANTRQLPILQAQTVTLEDGSEVPIQIPPGMPAQQAQMLVAYLKANPAAAKAAYEQAQAILKNPAMAHAFTNMMKPQENPAVMERLALLKDDPDLQPMFEDMKTNGQAAFQKYWDDTDTMLKISKKLRELEAAKAGESGEPAADGEAPSAKPPPPTATNLHEAAKQGDLEVAAKLIEEGADVNQLNDRGISPLGVAVGFNRLEMVQLLLSKGGDMAFRDPKNNTLMHYAAGYGRSAIAKALLEAGADAEAENSSKQTPLDVAKLNGEKEMAKWLQLRLKAAKKAAAAAKKGGAAKEEGAAAEAEAAAEAPAKEEAAAEAK